jgi:hypothetical protein
MTDPTTKTAARTEGWGSLVNATSAHYFVKGRSLCGTWLALTPPHWESNQEDGHEAPTRGSGTCIRCWRKRKAPTRRKTR